MNLQALLENGYIVAADDWLRMAVVWDGNSTFNVYKNRDEDVWVLEDVFVSARINGHYSAKCQANSWIQFQYDKLVD